MIGTGSGINKGGYVEFDLKDATDSSAALNLSLWFKNDTAVTAAKWEDSSGNSNHATQSSEANQATVSGGGLDLEQGDSAHYDLTSTITIAQNPVSYTHLTLPTILRV